MRLLLILTTFTLTACGFLIPVSHPEPYPIGLIDRIVPGRTDKGDLEALLGQPQVSLQNGAIWIYGQSRVVLWDTGGPDQHDYQALLLEFDDERVSSVELLEDKYGCWSSGLCLVSGWPLFEEDNAPAFLDRELTAVVSRRDDDAQAKRFLPDAGACSLYIYKRQNLFWGREYAPPISIAGVKDEPLHSSGYLWLKVPPGSQQLVSGELEKTISCTAGGLQFIEIEQHMTLTTGGLRAHEVPAESGKAAVRERHLLLHWG